LAFSGVFTPVLAKHSKSFSLIDSISVGVDRMQRNFEPVRKQVEAWQRSELTDVTAKVVIYEAFVEADSKLPNTWPALVNGGQGSPSVIARSEKHLAPHCASSDSQDARRPRSAADRL
jgi:hypothetical protein